MESMSKDWRDKAECIGTDPELFFPDGEKTTADKDQIKKAAAYCLKCMVTEQCLDDALATNQNIGVRGGLSANERRALKRRRANEQRRAQ